MLVSGLINVMCMTYSVLSRKLASTFSIFILSGKNGQSLGSLCNFLRYFFKLLEAFATLPNHIDYLHPNIEDMAILYFCHNLSFICY